MNVLSGLAGMVAVLLAAGGVSKALEPAPTVRSFRAIGLAASPAVVRVLAVIEVALGIGVILFGGRWLTGIAAALFVAFTVVSARLLQVGDTSCGCFGARSARPSPVHVAVDAGAAAVLAVGAALGVPGLVGHWHSLPGAGFVELGLVALGGYLLVALLTVLPDTLDAIKGDIPDAVGEFRLRS